MVMGEHADGAPILISGEQSTPLARVNEHAHDERWLQTLIHRHPACLPIGEIEPAFDRLTPVCMELPVSSGSVDNLLMTPEGNIVIVEVKLWRNPESRRTVIAQALDYATAMFRMNYEDLESAVTGADFGDGQRPSSLYDLFRDHPDVLPEGAFVDRVNRNLTLGRIVVLVVGDGIRSQTEELVSGLQAHANFHFTFALVEMPIFRRGNGSDDADELLVVPRPLLQTRMVDRFVVTVHGGHVDVQDRSGKTERSPRRTGISEEQYWEAIENEFGSKSRQKLAEFVVSLDELGVVADVKKTLRIRWPMSDGRKLNLGYITKDGNIYTDWVERMVGKDLGLRYNEGLAKAWGGTVIKGDTMMWVGHQDRSDFRINDVEQKYGEWRELIRRFLNELMESD